MMNECLKKKIDVTSNGKLNQIMIFKAKFDHFDL